jgi:uncharacterized membrane protein YphA (DoxX/SURF4 family)
VTSLSTAPSKAAGITGWILGILPMPLLALSAFMKLTLPPQVVEGFEKQGWPTTVALPLGIVELACCALYLIPQTAVLGAILLTGYLGGAIATHVRVSEPFWIPALIGVVLWIGLYLRDPRLRVLAPIRCL